MNDREKLIALIGGTYYGRDNNSMVGKNFQQEFIAKIADHLIAHGVTIGKRSHWVEDDYGWARCAECGCLGVATWSRCPNCEAKMEVKKGD